MLLQDGFDEFHIGVCRFPGGLDKHQVGVVQLHPLDQELFQAAVANFISDCKTRQYGDADPCARSFFSSLEIANRDSLRWLRNTFCSSILSTISENSLPLMPIANGVEFNSLNETDFFAAKGWRGETTKQSGSDRKGLVTKPPGLLSDRTNGQIEFAFFKLLISRDSRLGE